MVFKIHVMNKSAKYNKIPRKMQGIVYIPVWNIFF